MNELLAQSALQALSLLDDIATSDCTMGMEDVQDLCDARELLSKALGCVYDEVTHRYTIGENNAS